MSNVVFELFAKLGLDSSEYEQGLDDAEKKANSIGGTIANGLKTVGKAGAAFGAAVGAATVAASTALVKGAGDVAAYGDNIDKMSQKMGISAQAYQEWDAIMQHSGTSIEALKPSMKTLANAAEKGSDAFEKLGISQEEVASLSQEDLFAKVISGLQGMEEGTERTYLTSQLLGRGATELGALLNTSAEDTEKMRQRVHELGGVMSDEAVKAAAAYQDSLQDMQTGFDSLKRNLVSEFLPSITGVMDGLTDIFAGDYESGLGKISEGITSLVDGITQKLPEVIQLGSSIIQTLATAIIDNLPTIFEAGMNLVIELGMAIIENLPKLIEIGLQLIITLAQGIVEAIPQLIPAIVDVITQIVTILTNPETLMQLVEASIQIVMAIASAIIDNVPLIMDAMMGLLEGALNTLSSGDSQFLSKGVEMILSLVNGIISNLPQIVQTVVQIITQFIATIGENLPQILQQGIEILAQLIVGLIQAIPQLIAAIPQIITSIVETFGQYDWASIGINILEGLKNGILGAVGSVIDAAKEAAGAIWDSITGFFDIHSPSKRMAWVGEMLDKGLANGIDAYSGLVDNAIADITDIADISADANINANGGRGANVGNNVIINVYGAPGQDEAEIARIVANTLRDEVVSIGAMA